MTWPQDETNPFAPPSAPPSTAPSAAAYPWAPAPDDDSVNPWSVVALLTGIVALFPVAVTAGVVALVQLRGRPRRGRGLAVSGLVLGGGWAVVLVLGLAGTLLDAGPTAGPLGRVADAGSTTVGTCLHEPAEGRSVSAPVPCSAPHQAEVYELGQLPDGPFPGYDEVDSRADDLCYDTFSYYLHTSYDASDYDYGWFAPDEGEWAGGERRVVCVVLPYAEDDLPLHSVKGSEGTDGRDAGAESST